MQQKTTGIPYLCIDKQCLQQITRPRMGNKRKMAYNTYLLPIIKLAPLPPPNQIPNWYYFHSVWLQLIVMPRTLYMRACVNIMADCE